MSIFRQSSLIFFTVPYLCSLFICVFFICVTSSTLNFYTLNSFIYHLQELPITTSQEIDSVQRLG